MKKTKFLSETSILFLSILGLWNFSFNSIDSTEISQGSTILLITNSDLKLEWQPFADWKKRIGKPTTIISTTEIASTYKGNDIQQKIRACALDFINNHGTKWVILGGDSEGNGGIVPHRNTPHAAYGTYYTLPTDYYYISETDWDTNNNEIYGEFYGDQESIAYTNDKAVIGRIPVRTKEDVLAYTNKVIAYESEYPEINFADNMVYTCNVKSAYAKLSTSNAVIKKECSNLKFSQFYEDETPWSEYTAGKTGLTANSWINSINLKQNGKIHMHGHGLIDLWVMNDGTHITDQVVNKLNNKNAYPVITTVSCFTGEFDGYQDPSITESMLRKPDGGAILILCPSRPGVPVFENPQKDFELMTTEGKMDATTTTMTKFWEYGQTHKISTGEALRMVKNEMAPLGKIHDRYHFVLCELNILGDPSLDLRSTNPTKAKLKITVKSKRKEHQIIIKSNPNTTICIWKGDVVYQVKQTDDKGTVKFSVDKQISGQILVSASGYNYNANLGEITIQ